MSTRTAALLLLAMLFGAACAVDAGIRHSDTARLATSLATARAEPDHSLRYNPARCDCPVWEMRLETRWLRVGLLGDPEILETLLEQALTDAGSDDLTTYRVQGTLGDVPRRCTPSTLCATFEVEQWVKRLEPTPPPAPPSSP